MNFNIPTIHKKDAYHDYPVSGHVTVSYCKFGILTHLQTFYTKKSEVKKTKNTSQRLMGCVRNAVSVITMLSSPDIP